MEREKRSPAFECCLCRTSSLTLFGHELDQFLCLLQKARNNREPEPELYDGTSQIKRNQFMPCNSLNDIGRTYYMNLLQLAHAKWVVLSN